MPSVLTATTTPYRASETWLYDTVIAPAIVALRRPMQDALLAELPKGATVLEVGSGGGQLAVDLAVARPDVTITGVDLSREQVARAARRAAPLGPRVRFLEGSALALPVSARSFDAVISVGSIKHWPDMAAGLRECVRALRPGGPLIVAEVDRGCHLDDARAFVGRWRMPAFFGPLALVLFRTYVAGQGLDLDEARALLDGLAVTDRAVARIDGSPGLLLRARAIPVA